MGSNIKFGNFFSSYEKVLQQVLIGTYPKQGV